MYLACGADGVSDGVLRVCVSLLGFSGRVGGRGGKVPVTPPAVLPTVSETPPRTGRGIWLVDFLLWGSLRQRRNQSEGRMEIGIGIASMS